MARRKTPPPTPPETVAEVYDLLKDHADSVGHQSLLREILEVKSLVKNSGLNGSSEAIHALAEVAPELVVIARSYKQEVEWKQAKALVLGNLVARVNWLRQPTSALKWLFVAVLGGILWQGGTAVNNTIHVHFPWFP